MVSDLSMPHGKVSEFISFPWFGFTLVIKLRNFIFKVITCSALFFFIKKMMSDLNMSCQTVSDMV